MVQNTSVIHVKFLAVLKKLKTLPHLVLMAALLNISLPVVPEQIHANGCPDLKIIFARGSGATRYDNAEYQTLKESIRTKLKTSTLSYEIDDLDYPAVSIDITKGHLDTLLGAYFSGGESYDFGESMKAGVKEMTSIINSKTCPNTKYVIAGYSQGAMVVDYSLDLVNPDKIIYAATFGDPKIYLPEGAGLVPAACKGENLSEYRMYVPDCRAHKGILGARMPYRADAYYGKVGTWCNRMDVLCSAYYNIGDHTKYVEAGLVEDISRVLVSKIASAFNFKNEYTSPHDTAILIDSTGSMSYLISEYKAEAYKLAEKTLSSGGRVALYDYRDLDDPYDPVEGCSFETCTLESFQVALDKIAADGGGDEPESLLSASFHAMKSLNWNFGSTKSLVILTDATYHSPDRDGITFYDVTTLSKQIDPVNFYIITLPELQSDYAALAEATDGAVVSTVDDLSELTETIIARYDSLPRVEEDLSSDALITPHLEITNINYLTSDTATIAFTTDGAKTMVILNDTILGLTDETSITLNDLRPEEENILTLVPFLNDVRGESVSTELKMSTPSQEKNLETTPETDTSSQKDNPNTSIQGSSSETPSEENNSETPIQENNLEKTPEANSVNSTIPFTIPKAPNTGRQ